MIPIAKPSVGEDEASAAADIIRSGTIASGEEVSQFETEFSRFMGSRHSIATSSGTAALHVALLAAGISAGDEVIVPTFTFIATASAVSMCNATPVFADVDEKYYSLDPESTLEQINPRTRAIIPVHLFGQPCDMKTLGEICDDHHLLMIEDCAQAHGTRFEGTMTGSFGLSGCYSFYPTKNMTTGEGGMVTTQHDEYAQHVKRLINHGQASKYSHTEIGYNYRLTNIGAVIGRIQLRKLPEFNRKRQENAAYYQKHITRKGIICPAIRRGCEHVFHQYAIRVLPECDLSRDQLTKALTHEGIGTAIHYPTPVHKQPVYQGKIKSSPAPVSIQLANEILSLPIWPGLTMDNLAFICKSINEAI
ncbi:MAG TPA: DegT/DnrJ/EryC1/StrS family aminotransferase [Methanospirillum sp.]|uniref:DegT/DnrJ/EryC1/StrS family aminotransferase n=1 Tax=Methanospirillum sp. TaxID=45200 RepID=UPI002D042041|nr:DegT/DnrJ/EryC1/StrS family aminotransferase [Methanospirillum sp.]HWQ64838.1 DegT/DnrJ/EryC1/StrS family aminotransferase [Methanospirillum sp.]